MKQREYSYGSFIASKISPFGLASGGSNVRNGLFSPCADADDERGIALPAASPAHSMIVRKENLMDLARPVAVMCSL